MALAQLRSTEIVKLYFSTNSPVTVLRKLKKKYPAENMKKYHVYRAVKRFKKTDSVIYDQHRNPGQSGVQKHCRSETSERRNATNISKKVLGNISNQASRTRVHRMLRFDRNTYTVHNINDATSQRQ